MPTLEVSQVFDRYRIVRWLGSGVSGESYEADDSILLRKVTLKLIHPQAALPDSARRQFFREMQGISTLKHDYIAEVLDYGENNDQLYVARRYASNGSLLSAEGRTWFRPPLNVADAIRYIHQLAQALHHIHTRGYVHGALTFSNILVLRGPNLDNEADYAPFLLTDVGLAQFARRFGQQLQPPLPVTSAPEQLGRRVLPASDQFALAVLLYFWLTGRPPYIGTTQEIEQLKLTETITPLSTINPSVSLEQDGMLLRALSVSPSDRYPTILAFADALLATLVEPSPEAEAEEYAPEPQAMSDSAVLADEHDTDQEPEIVTASFANEDIVVEPVFDEDIAVAPATFDEILPVMDEAPGSSNAEPYTEELQPTEITLPAKRITRPLEAIPEAIPEETEVVFAPVSTTTARLIVTSPYAAEPVEMILQKGEITIGRAGSSDILLDHDNLTSRHHALIKYEDQSYMLYDRRSANGVFVNGQPISASDGHPLLDGDHISIGNYELIFRVGISSNRSEANGHTGAIVADYEMTHQF